MCGIAGLITRDEPLSHASRGALFDRAMTAIAHRGPDNQATYLDDRVWLGHTRLAIIDLSCAANQPFRAESGQLVCTYNGEIYNFRRIRDQLVREGYAFRSRSDTEVLLAAFQVWGPSFADRLVGMFAFAIWDNVNRRLVFGRDRFGEKPMYVFQSEELFAFASELRSLLLLAGPASQRLDERAIDGYLRFGFVPESLSLFQGVQKVAPRTVSTLQVHEWTTQKSTYWSVGDVSDGLGAEIDARLKRESRDAIVLSALSNAVAHTLESDVPIAIALSGGIDSAAIAALARKAAPDANFEAISVGYPGRPKYDERSAAAALAKSLRIPLHEVEIPLDSFVDGLPALVRQMGEPVADIAAFAHAAVPRAAHELGLKVLLTGLGGDELFWGYHWVQNAARSGEANQSIWKNYRGTERKVLRNYASEAKKRLKHVDFRQIVGSLRLAAAEQRRDVNHEDAPLWSAQPDFRSAVGLSRQIYGPRMKQYIDAHTFWIPELTRHQACSLEQATIAILIQTWLVANSLAISDRVSMAVGVEARAPLLDVELFETVTQLRKRESDVLLPQKSWLRSALKGVLPLEVLERPKRGFQPPVLDWMRGALTAYMPLTLEGALVSDAIVDAKQARSLVLRADTDSTYRFFCFKLLLLGMSIDALRSDAAV